MKKSNPLNIARMRKVYQESTQGQWLVGADTKGNISLVTRTEVHSFGVKDSQASLDARFIAQAQMGMDTLLKIAEGVKQLDIQEIINLLPADSNNAQVLSELLDVMDSEVD